MGKTGSVLKAENAAREAKKRETRAARAAEKAAAREARDGLGPLTVREEAFCAAFVRLGNGKAAALEVGISEAAASATASRWRSYPRVRDRIEVLQKQAADAAVMGAQEVLRELTRIARSDIRKLFDERGALRKLNELDDETAAVVSSVESDDIFESDGEGGRQHTGYTRKVRLWSKLTALERLGEHHQLFHKPDDKDRLPSMTFNFHIGKGAR